MLALSVLGPDVRVLRRRGAGRGFTVTFGGPARHGARQGEYRDEPWPLLACPHTFLTCVIRSATERSRMSSMAKSAGTGNWSWNMRKSVSLSRRCFFLL